MYGYGVCAFVVCETLTARNYICAVDSPGGRPSRGHSEIVAEQRSSSRCVGVRQPGAQRHRAPWVGEATSVARSLCLVSRLYSKFGDGCVECGRLLVGHLIALRLALLPRAAHCVLSMCSGNVSTRCARARFLLSGRWRKGLCQRVCVGMRWVLGGLRQRERPRFRACPFRVGRGKRLKYLQ